MLYKDQTIKITASCDEWMMTNSAVSVSDIVGYSHCYAPQHKSKEALDVSLGYTSPCGFSILPKLVCCSRGWCIPGQSLCKQGLYVLDWR
ncbi:hypothetical protein TNCV_676871 [Trichonephila clavipes]|nr:hypothetical protein TNCV_676871 [Trichonephila clavipes]